MKRHNYNIGPHFLVWVDRGWFSVRVGRWYFKLRHLPTWPLRFSERNGFGYRRLLRFRGWELGLVTGGAA